MSSFLYRFINHFKTITKHKLLVQSYCFKLGLYKQGLLHDLSKYSPVEFFSGVKYYQGNRSPIDAEKEVLGYSAGWLHHKGRNKHHWEYWYDITDEGFKPLEMPIEYNVEMVCDRISATKTYLKNNYNNASAYNYFMNNLKFTPMHPKTIERTKYMLGLIKDYGEEEGFKLIKEYFKNNK